MTAYQLTKGLLQGLSWPLPGFCVKDSTTKLS
jgi:hypothetical protein